MSSQGKQAACEVDAELAPILAAQRARVLTRPSLEAVTPAEMRQRAAAEFVFWNSDPEPVALVSDKQISAPHREIGVRIYDDAPALAKGTLVWLHGGGWVIGDLDLEDNALRRLARASGARIISVDYRLAPEHPYPAAIDDAVAVCR